MLLSLIITSVVGIFLNFFAIVFKINFIANLFGGRITSLLVLFSLVIIYKYLTDNQMVNRMEGVYLRLFFVFPHPVFLAQQLISMFLIKKIWSLVTLIPSIILGYGLISRYGNTVTLPFSEELKLIQKFIDISTLNIGPALVSTILLYNFVKLIFVLLMLIIGFGMIQKKFINRKLSSQNKSYTSFLKFREGKILYTMMTSVLMSISSVLGFSYSYQFSFNSNAWSINQVQDLRDAQIWAKTQTPTNSTFIVNPNKPFLPWRTLSSRASVPLGKVIGAYGYHDYMDEFNVRLTEFYEEFPGSNSIGSQDICLFVSKFGGNYIIDSIDQEYFFDNVNTNYKNDSYFIGKIDCQNAK